jgi:hypothetical protein
MRTLIKQSATFVDKNEVKHVKWPLETVHKCKEDRDDIIIKLRVATILGNLDKIKCKLYFSDNLGVKFIETTIWAVCEGNVIIKSGTWIPIRRVVDVII